MSPQSRVELPSLGTIRLITSGRVTGLPHIVELRFVTLNGSFYVIGSRSRSDWARNVIASGEATVRQGEALRDVRVTRATPEQTAEVREAFGRKYGARVLHQWYGDSQLCLSLAPLGPSRFRGLSSGEQEVATTFADWVSRKEDYISNVSAAFDSASLEYDYTIRRNFVNTWIRRKSIHELLSICRPDDVLLEIGCGTGAEAVEIAKNVAQVVATDVSDGMIDLLDRKVRARHLEGRVIPSKMRAADVANAKSLTQGAGFRIVYSFNGALNCEPQVRRFVDGLYVTLADGGYFVCSIRNSLCLSEALSHAAVLQFDRMAPRKESPVMVSVGGQEIPSTYYLPWDFEALFSSKFETVKRIGLPAILPPAYLNDYVLKLGPFVRLFEAMEERLSGHFPLNRFGDQTLFVFKKRKDVRAP